VVSDFEEIGGKDMTALSGNRFLLRSKPGAAIFWGGFIAGTLDIASAAITTVMGGGSPIRMLQGIAYALIGVGAFKGGLGTALLGLACHFSITFGAAAAYWMVSRMMPVLIKKAVACGLLYGIVVYGITNYVIVPLSRIGRVLTHDPKQIAIGLVILMIGVGLPISLTARRYSGIAAKLGS
jgi:hypothetical protein